MIKSEHSRIQQQKFCESDQSYEETSRVTNGFNRRSENYVNFISTDLSAQMMSTWKDGQNSGR